MPTPAGAHFQRALAAHQANRLDAAEQAYRAALEADPRHADSLHLLGVLMRQRGRAGEAKRLIGEAIAIKPDVGTFFYNRANALSDLGETDAAAADFGRAAELDPGNPDIVAGHAACLVRTDPVRAANIALAASSTHPRNAELRFILGNALKAAEQHEAAIRAFESALTLDPRYVDALYNLGNSLLTVHRYDEAAAAFRHTLDIRPTHVEAMCGLGMCTRNSPEAVGWYNRAIAIKPDFALAHSNLAHTLLLGGDFEQGFREYEWRWHHPETPPRDFSQPAWTGGDLGDGVLLLHAEQGFGDTLQFVRYVTLAAARTRRVVLEVQPELVRLLAAQQLPVEAIVGRGAALPHFDAHLPLLSLPLVFGTRLETVPAPSRYLSAPRELSERWAARLGPRQARRIGLVWAGNPRHQNDARRSVRLADLAPLFAIAGTAFYGLQLGAAGAEAKSPPPGAPFTDLAPEIGDFADTAAILEQLDALATVDTSTAHLAGALGRPVFMLLPHAPDWRWLLGRDTTPWYPETRLVRFAEQGTKQEWIGRLASQLADFTKAAEA